MIHKTMISKTLQRSSVADCFAGFAWQGNQVVRPDRFIPQAASWKTAAVQDFFRQYNWAGHIRRQTADLPDQIDTSFSVKLPVQQFFDCFVWAGQAKVAPQPIAPLAEPSGDRPRDFKLANFSNLF
jgi:hypothetical protein